MLYSINNTQVKEVPHQEEYRKSLELLSSEETAELKVIFEKIINENNNHNSYVLGSKHLDEPRLRELLLKACEGRKSDLGQYFGLYLYQAFIDHAKEWTFLRPESTGRLAAKGYSYYLRKR